MAKMTADEIRAAAAALALEEAYELREAQKQISERVTANRTAVRNALAMGYFTDEQAAEAEEFYPVRERASAEERLEKLREQLARAEEKATKATRDELIAEGVISEGSAS